METLKSVFLIEAQDQLDALESALLALERTPSDEANIHGAFRAAHTIKGSSGMAEATTVAAFTHNVENVLQRMRDGQLSANADLVSALLACTDHIQTLVGFFSQSTAPDVQATAAGQALLERLQPWLESKPVSAATQTPPSTVQHDLSPQTDTPFLTGEHWHIHLRMGPEIFQRGIDPLNQLRYLSTLGPWMRVRLLSSPVSSCDELDALDAELCHLGFIIDFQGDVTAPDIEDAFSFLQGECTLHVLPPKTSKTDLLQWIKTVLEQGETTIETLLTDLLLSEVLVAEQQVQLLQELLMAAPAQAVPDQTAATAATTTKTNRPVNSAKGRAPERATAAQLRVDADKLDRLVDLVGELVIAGAAATVMSQRVGHAELVETMSVLSRLIEDMRESAMQMRMVQIGVTFNRFQRVVRDVSQELGKNIDLLTEGGETELDKSVVEKIGDPLMHLVRNSVDHGIESAEKRIACGKPAKGTVVLSAAHQAGSIILQIRDDGAGLNTQKILAKAIERKLVSPTQTLSEAEIHQLIFEPGFSTADQVTELSGRGVGMDVVRRNIQALRGTVDVSSTAGKGCTFTIRLPLTLAIIDGFRVGIGDAHFVIPLDMVAECIQHDSIEHSCDYLNLRGKLLPFVRLRELFDSDAPTQSSVQENVVVVQHGDQKVGIVVEKLYGEMQAVIKPLGIMFQNIKGLAGTTLLGGGEIAVILDIPALIEGVQRT